MPIRAVTTGKFTAFEIVTELRALDASTPGLIAPRAVAEAMLQHAWAREAQAAWQTLAEITVLWRTFEDLDALEQRRIAPVIGDRLRELDDLLWTLIGEGPFSLTGALPDAHASGAHAVEIEGRSYPSDPESLVESTAKRLLAVKAGAP